MTYTVNDIIYKKAVKWQNTLPVWPCIWLEGYLVKYVSSTGHK